MMSLHIAFLSCRDITLRLSKHSALGTWHSVPCTLHPVLSILYLHHHLLAVDDIYISFNKLVAVYTDTLKIVYIIVGSCLNKVLHAC